MDLGWGHETAGERASFHHPINAAVMYRHTDGGDLVEATGSSEAILSQISDAAAVVFRYGYSGSTLDAGMLNVTFTADSWIDSGGTSSTESLSQVAIITQAESFFISISGGIELRAADLFDEPLMSVTAEVTLEIDFVRN